MKEYIASLSDEQKSLLRSVQKGKIGHVINSLTQFPYLIEDEMFSYVLLVAALHKNHKPISIGLIKNGCSLKCLKKTDYYETPLYYAIQLDAMGIFKLLYKRGASICDWDAKGENALELAMRSRDTRFWDFIIDQVNDDELNPHCKEHIAIFHAACYRGDVSLIKRFLIRDFSVNSHSESELEEWAGATPLQFAIKNRQHAHENVGFLLSFNVDFDAQDEQGNTALHLLLEIREKRSQGRKYEFIDEILTSYVLRSCNATKLNNSTNLRGISHFHILCSVEWDDAKHCGLSSERLVEILEHFIKNGVDVNSSNNLESTEDRHLYYAGYTALHWAAQKSGLGILKLLLENGADPAKTDARGNTPLHVLDFKNPDSVEMAELLLKSGANVDVENDENDTPLHLAFHAQNRNEPLMQLLLSASHGVSNLVSNDGLSYLHIASTRDLNKVKILVENGASIEIRTESERGGFSGYSPLHFAIAFNKVEIVGYLLAQGAEVNTVVGEHRSSPLHLACTEPLKFFFKPPTKNDDFTQASRSFKEDENSDWVKSRKDQIRIIELLLEFGACTKKQDSEKMTPLFAVCSFSRPVSSDSDPRVGDDVAKEIVTRQKLIIGVFLHHGADVNARGDNGRSLLHISSRNFKIYETRRDLAEFLLSRGASVDAVDDDGCTPLHSITGESSRLPYIGPFLQDFLSFIDLLIKHGADVNARSNRLHTPLHSAVNHSHKDDENERILTRFLNHPDIQIDPQDQKCYTPLFVAVATCKPCCVRKLLDAGADIRVERYNGHSPISLLRDNFRDLFYQWNRDFPNMCMIIIEHVKKLIKLNYFVSNKVKKHLEDLMKLTEKDFSTLDSAIDEEMEKLKSVKLDNYTSLFKILMKDPNSMAKHAKNELFVEFVYSVRLQSEFPLFSGFLKRQFKRGLTRSLRLESAKKVLQVVTETNWPDSCSEHILSYLNNADLKLLTQCSSVVDPCKSSGEVLREAKVNRAKVLRQN